MEFKILHFDQSNIGGSYIVDEIFKIFFCTGRAGCRHNSIVANGIRQIHEHEGEGGIGTCLHWHRKMV